MEKRKIVIVEDEDCEASTLRDYIDRFQKVSNVKFVVKRFSNATTFLRNYPHDTDIVFMDINLPGMSGMDAIKKLREHDPNVVVIFVTNLAHYAVEGYSVDALDFIMKPVSYFNFTMKFKRALARAQKRQSFSFWIDCKGGGKQNISTSDLKYIEIRSHLLTYHTTRGNFDSWGSLASMEELLKDAPFVLCNRCYLVNLKYVEGVDEYDLNLDGEILTISRAKRSAFINALNCYLAGGEKCD